MIRVLLPAPLRSLAHIDGELLLAVDAPITLRTTVDAVERAYPQLKGTIRDHTTLKRRAFVRYYACEKDLSHESLDMVLPSAVLEGNEPFLIVGAMAGG